MQDSLENLQAAIDDFVRKRDWQQFHSPKNLSMALAVEAGELMEHFQWLSQQKSHNLDEKTRQEVAMEMADVLIYLIRLADQLEVDLLAASREKMVTNGQKYPVDRCRGRADKYSAYR